MDEYESLGHMVNIGPYPQSIHPYGYFLPHHGVVWFLMVAAKSLFLLL